MDALGTLRAKGIRTGRGIQRRLSGATEEMAGAIRRRGMRVRSSGPRGLGRVAVHRAWILDGRTLDLLVSPDGEDAAFDAGRHELVVRARPPRTWRAALVGSRTRSLPALEAVGERIRDHDGRQWIQVHLPLHPLLEVVDLQSLPDRLRLEVFLRSAGTPGRRWWHERPMDVRVVDGADRTPNGAMLLPVPPVAETGVQLQFDIVNGCSVRVTRLAPIPEIAGVDLSRGSVDLALVGSPRSAAVARRVWVLPRAEFEAAHPADERLELRRGADGWWRLDPKALIGVLDSRESPTEVVFDVWADWDTDGTGSSDRTGRVGRRRSDLRQLRGAVQLPTMWIGATGRAVDHRSDAVAKVVPYYARSRHLSIRIRSLTAEAP